jgi:hypothetical protein
MPFEPLQPLAGYITTIRRRLPPCDRVIADYNVRTRHATNRITFVSLTQPLDLSPHLSTQATASSRAKLRPRSHSLRVGAGFCATRRPPLTQEQLDPGECARRPKWIQWPRSERRRAAELSHRSGPNSSAILSMWGCGARPARAKRLRFVLGDATRQMPSYIRFIAAALTAGRMLVQHFPSRPLARLGRSVNPRNVNCIRGCRSAFNV